MESDSRATVGAPKMDRVGILGTLLRVPFANIEKTLAGDTVAFERCTDETRHLKVRPGDKAEIESQDSMNYTITL